MRSKLTLTMDTDIIKSVKKYAGESKRSVSRLAEDYFRKLVNESTKKERHSPLVKELSGVISIDDLNAIPDYVEYLERKYD